MPRGVHCDYRRCMKWVCNHHFGDSLVSWIMPFLFNSNWSKSVSIDWFVNFVENKPPFCHKRYSSQISCMTSGQLTFTWHADQHARYSARLRLIAWNLLSFYFFLWINDQNYICKAYLPERISGIGFVHMYWDHLVASSSLISPAF